MTGSYPLYPIVVVDDEAAALKSVEINLRAGGFDHVKCFQDSREVLPYLHGNRVELLLLDLTMPEISGQDILNVVEKEHPGLPVIVITGLNDVNTAVECMKSGAVDYLLKPVERNRLLSSVKKFIELEELKRNYQNLKERLLSDELRHPEAFSHIVTRNGKMKGLFRYIEAIAGTREPILITGETGTGKELLARAAHEAGEMKGEFVAVNVAGLDDTVFTDTLFGHRKGAYTGAADARKGLVEQAHMGTLFLDEIGDLSLSSQAKLLRLIQEKEYFPLGADIPKHSSARILVATNRDLADRIRKDEFRKDLFYRLSVHVIKIPPLYERRDDLRELIPYFLKEAAESMGKSVPSPPPELYDLLDSYHFPGNVRELRSMIFDAVSRHKSKVLSLSVFYNALGLDESKETSFPVEPSAGTLYSSFKQLPSLKGAENQLIEEALARSKGNQSMAAKLLGMSRQALNNRLKKLR